MIEVVNFRKENGVKSMKFISKNKKYIKSAVKHIPEVKEGIFSGTTRGFGFVQIEGEDDIFVPERETKGALHGDSVLVEITSRGEKGKKCLQSYYFSGIIN